MSFLFCLQVLQLLITGNLLRNTQSCFHFLHSLVKMIQTKLFVAISFYNHHGFVPHLLSRHNHPFGRKVIAQKLYVKCISEGIDYFCNAWSVKKNQSCLMRNISKIYIYIFLNICYI